MDLEAIITVYGYPALLIGCLLEGGTVVFIAGALAHGSYLRLPWIIGITFCCAFGADQFFFQLGKRKGKVFLAKWPRWEPRIDKARRFLVAYKTFAILGFRFIYGMRTITPIVIGASGIETRSFVLLNLCSSMLWATVVACSGYFFGHAINNVLNGVMHYKLGFLLVIAAVSAGIWYFRYRVKK